MKKGQIVEGIVTKVDFPNKGIVKVEGEEKTLIVKNAVSGRSDITMSAFWSLRRLYVSVITI